MAFFQQKYTRITPLYLRSAVLGIALFFPLLSLAETPPVEAMLQPSFIDPYIDGPREYVAEKFSSFASDVDYFFGDERNYQEINKSVLQLNLTRLIEQGGNTNVIFSGRAKFLLPGFQQRISRWQSRFHLLLETNPDKNLPGSGTSTQQGKSSLFQESSTSTSYGAALRIENEENSLWRLSADAGIKVDDLSLPPFVRSRISYSAPLRAVQVQLAESLFWFSTTGAGENTQLDVDHHLSDSLLFRSTSGATWLHDKQNFDLRQDLSLYQTLDAHHSVLYQFSTTGVTNPQTQITEYIALLLYRQRLHRDWMFLELSPQLHYPKATDYHLNSQLFVRLEVLFSK